MLDADAVINNSSQKVGGSNAYPDPKKVAESGSRKHIGYAPEQNFLLFIQPRWQLRTFLITIMFSFNEFAFTVKSNTKK